MAQDAELKLKVSLDLAFFRQQLSTIGTQLGGQSVPIAIRFDKKAIADQYRLLDRYIRGKKFTVELNLVGGLTKNEFDKIKGRLDDLRELRKVEIPIGIKNGATGKDVDKVVASIKERLAQNQQIKQGGGKLRIETSVKPSITNQDIADFKKAVKDKLSKIGALEIPTKLDVPKVEDLLKALQKNINRQKPLLAKTSIKPSILSADVKAFKKAAESKLSGITVKINAELETIGGGKTKAQIEKEVLAGLERIQQMGAARMGGGVTEPARRESLRQSLQGRDIGELKDIGRQLGVANVGKFRNTQNLIEKIVTESSIEMITKYLDPQAVMRNSDRSGLNKVLDTFARGLFNMLGMDVASMRQQAAQRRALPGVNFPATVPSRPVSIGPSGTGRALPPGAIPGALPGTAFGAQKYLPTNLGVELQEILRKAAYAFVDAVRQQVRTAKIGIGASMQAALPAARVAGLLPASVGREPSRYAMGGESREQMMARRTAEAYARSALRGMDVMGGGAGRPPSPYSYAYRSARPTSAIIPYAQPGAIVPSTVSAGGGTAPPGGGGGGFDMGGFGGFGSAMGNINLPGSGTIRELGDEFGFAAKQVLLFGTAYKALAFFQNFPAQVGAAVGQLQTFRNTLGAISPTAQEAAASNRLILDLVEKYNVPLQSARDGFTKLYASMAPAGFSGDEIRNLFTGITQAAATFGMSADKVDRVNYAFAQMASKGQVMSEELKGQLGDVLPGAMALFAEAAGFKGPKAIQDFSAALEDGAYKGQAMVALLKNVGVIMQQEFGPGAEGAARTFQGVINRMQNSMTLLYESFEPVAVNFLNGVVVPLTSGIKQISDGFNAFFTGAVAQTSGGFAIAQELERLRPAFDGIRANIAELVGQFGQFARIALEVSKVLLQIAGNPIVGYLARLYAIALPINIALNVMRGLWAANALQLVIFNARVATGTSTLSAFRGMMAATGATAQTTTASIRAAGITLRTFFAATGVGLVVTGISMLIERIMMLNQKMDETRQKAAGAANAIRMMSSTEARAAEQSYTGFARSLEGLNKQLQEGQLKGKAWIAVNRQQQAALEAAGVVPSVVRGQAQVQPGRIGGAYQKLVQLQGEASYRVTQTKFEEKQMQQQAVLAPIPPSEGDGAKAKGKTKELDTYNKSQLDFIKQRFDAEKLVLDQQMQANLLSKTSYDIKLAELTLETERAELQERFRLESEKIKADNLSAADKALALKDQEVFLQNALVQAEKKRDIAVKGAKLELRKPFVDALRSENTEIEKQEMLLNNLKQGYGELTAEQEANFLVEEKIVQLKADEQKLIRSDIDNLREQIRLRIENGKLLEKEKGLFEAQRGLGIIGGGLRAGFTGSAAGVFERAMEQYGDTDYATKLANIETSAMQLRSVFEGLQGAIAGVSGAFANMLTEGIANMITGTASAKEVFASFLQSVGQALSQAASQMIATYIAIGIAKMFAGLGGASSDMSKTGISEGTLAPMRQYPMITSANGNVLKGGFQAFANGGVVTGPTLGLVGEGKYNEAVVPLPDGRSIPVQLGGRSARDLMGNGAPGMPQAPSLSMKFETTKINGIEYVSREQLEQAMAETRRVSIVGGAQRGMSMTLDKIKQSPSTRSSIGIR